MHDSTFTTGGVGIFSAAGPVIVGPNVNVQANITLAAEKFAARY